jgi:hypothetical protein
MSRTRTRNHLRPARGRLALAVSLGLLGALAAPVASHAATLGPATIDGVDSIRFVAAPGESNHLSVRPGPPGVVTFVDPGATIDPQGPTCVTVSAHEARCALVPALNVSLGDRDDTLTVDVDKSGRVSGDAGNDTLTGGPGDEALLGGAGDDVLDGRGGADLLAGGDGSDRASYASRTAPVTVNLATLVLGEEGQADEHDTVASDVERVTGGAGNDSLTGNAAANLLDGRAGNDVVDGGAGNDSVAGGDGNDSLDGGTGDDTVDGGAGNDRVTGGSGADSLFGGPGSDTLRGRDETVDRLDCGTDADVADADGNDTVSNCESGGPAPVPTPTPPLTMPFNFIFGNVALPDQPVTLQHGRITLSVSCPAETPTGRCSGVISLVPFAKLGKGHAKAHSSRRTRRFKRIADQAYAVKAGKKAKVRVRISSLGRRAVNRAGTLKVKVYLRRTKRAKKATKIGTLKVHASRRTKRRHVKA